MPLTAFNGEKNNPYVRIGYEMIELPIDKYRQILLFLQCSSRSPQPDLKMDPGSAWQNNG